MTKIDVAILLLKQTLNAGVRAGYALVDTWLAMEAMIRAVLTEGLDVIGMDKQNKPRYRYKGGYTLLELQKFVIFSGTGNIFGSLCVTNKNGIPVKIVFVNNRNKKSQVSLSFKYRLWLVKCRNRTHIWERMIYRMFFSKPLKLF